MEARRDEDEATAMEARRGDSEMPMPSAMEGNLIIILTKFFWTPIFTEECPLLTVANDALAPIFGEEKKCVSNFYVARSRFVGYNRRPQHSFKTLVQRSCSTPCSIRNGAETPLLIVRHQRIVVEQ